MAKKWLGRSISIALVLCLLLAAVPFSTFAAVTPSKSTTIYTVDDNGVPVSRSARFYTVSGGFVSATTVKRPNASGSERVVEATLKIASELFDQEIGYESISEPIRIANTQSSMSLKFDYAIQVGTGGSITRGQNDYIPVTESGTYIIPKGTSDVWFYLTSGAQQGADTYMTISNFQYFDPTAPVDVTVNAAEHGAVQIEDYSQKVGFGSGCIASYTEGVVPSWGIFMQPIPDSGYQFFGFVDQDNNKITINSSDWTYYPSKNITVTPIFARPGIDPVFAVGNKLFTDLSSASATGGTIIPVQDCTIPAGNYTISNGATLLIPDDASNTLYTDYPFLTRSVVSPSAYRKLTLASGAVLNFETGTSMSVGGKLYAAGGGGSCSVTGSYGQMIIENGASMNFASGSTLYAWGFVTGKAGEAVTNDVKVHMYPGATVYEDFQICDFSGGTNTLNLMRASTVFFPLSQYYIQNVECRMQIDSGATENIYGALWALSQFNAATMVFISSEDGALFKLEQGHIEKYYDFEEDMVKCDIYGDATISPVEVTIAGQAINTTQRQMPINNIGVNLKEGTLATEQAIMILPDSYITVDDGATFEIRSDVYLVDAADWIGGNHVYPSSNLRPLVYSATLADNGVNNGKSPRAQKGGAGSMDSAMLDINGTVIVSENAVLGTTESGAVIQSSEMTGTLVNNSTVTAAPLYMATFSSKITCTANSDIAQDFKYDSELGVWEVDPDAFRYFKGISLSLQGDVNLNAFFEIKDGTDISDYTATLGGKQFTYNSASTDSCSYIVGPDANGRYKISYPVKIAELTMDVYATLNYGSELVDNTIYKAAKYGDSINDYLPDHDAAMTAGEYYLVGSINGVDSWSPETADGAYQFGSNFEADGEYVLWNVSLAKGDEIKVVQYNEGGTFTWFPEGTGNNYVVNKTSNYNIYFRPAKDATDSNWHYGTFYVQEEPDAAVKERYMCGTLVQSMLNYGARAQEWFNTNTTNLADTYVKAPQFGPVSSDRVIDKLGGTTATIDESGFKNNYGLEYFGSSLVLNESTKIKHYFYLDNAAKYAAVKSGFTFNGVSVTGKTGVLGGRDIVYFEISGIPATELDTRFVLTNTQGGSVISYSALDYAQRRIADDTEEQGLKNLMYSLYWYNVYADAYWS